MFWDLFSGIAIFLPIYHNLEIEKATKDIPYWSTHYTKYLLIKFQKHKYGKKGKHLKASSLGLYSLDCSRLRGDLIEVYKIDKLTAQAILPKLGEIENQKT